MKKVLVIVDMQNDFLTGPLGNAECAATVPEVIKLIESGEYDTIITTQDTHFDDYLDTQEGKNLPVVHCIMGTEGWQIHNDVKKALDAKFETDDLKVAGVTKHSFGDMDKLPRLLRQFAGDIEEIHFVGVCTGICVISNVLIAKAAVPETKICVIERACACVTPESHKTAIEAMKMCQVEAR